MMDASSTPLTNPVAARNLGFVFCDRTASFLSVPLYPTESTINNWQLTLVDGKVAAAPYFLRKDALYQTLLPELGGSGLVRAFGLSSSNERTRSAERCVVLNP